MEFFVIKKSLTLCMAHIKQQIQKEMINNTNTTSSYIIQAKQACNFHSILNEFFPVVLSFLIIEYIEDIFDIIVTMTPHSHCPTIYDRIIQVTNDELHINHTYTIFITNSAFVFYKLIVDSLIILDSREKLSRAEDHLDFVNYYVNRYEPLKIQMNRTFYSYEPFNKEMIQRINNYEQFNKEMIVVVALFNHLDKIRL